MHPVQCIFCGSQTCYTECRWIWIHDCTKKDKSHQRNLKWSDAPWPLHSRLTHDQRENLIKYNHCIQQQESLPELPSPWCVKSGRTIPCQIPASVNTCKTLMTPPPTPPSHFSKFISLAFVLCHVVVQEGRIHSWLTHDPGRIQNSWETPELFLVQCSRFSESQRQPVFFVNRRQAGLRQIRYLGGKVNRQIW